MSRGNLSVQMTKLAEAGLVDIEKSFVDNRPRTVYKLTRKGRTSLAAYKADMATLLEDAPRLIWSRLAIALSRGRRRRRGGLGGGGVATEPDVAPPANGACCSRAAWDSQNAPR